MIKLDDSQEVAAHQLIVNGNDHRRDTCRNGSIIQPPGIDRNITGRRAMDHFAAKRIADHRVRITNLVGIRHVAICIFVHKHTEAGFCQISA